MVGGFNTELMGAYHSTNFSGFYPGYHVPPNGVALPFEK